MPISAVKRANQKRGKKGSGGMPAVNTKKKAKAEANASKSGPKTGDKRKHTEEKSSRKRTKNEVLDVPETTAVTSDGEISEEDLAYFSKVDANEYKFLEKLDALSLSR
jgi:hypothetical protein